MDQVKPEIIRVPQYERMVAFSEMYRMRPDFCYGFPKLDAATAGLHQGEIVVVGSRTGEGKSSILIQMVAQLASQGRKIVYFSNEMKRETLWAKVAARELHISTKKIMTGELLEHEKDRVRGFFEDRFARYPLFIYDQREGTDPMKIVSILQKEKPDLFVVDHIQHVESDNAYIKTHEKLALFMQTIKAQVTAHNYTAMLASQCNRNVEGRTYYLPFMSDLKGSGSIEEDADVIMLLAWPYKTIVSRDIFGEGKAPDKQHGRGQAVKFTESDYYIELAKNRFGEPGYIKLEFHPYFSEFKEPQEVVALPEPPAKPVQEKIDFRGQK